MTRCGFATGLLIDGTHHPPAPPVSKPEMKLLVLAQTPPPVHGQSVMVRALVEGLPPLGIPVHHVNLGLSRDAADIGRWRLGKVFALCSAIGRALAARFRYDCDTLYYVPAPGKRGAVYRDWLVMLLCRPFFRRLVLHWHAAGLAEWLAQHGTGIEQAITRRLLGGADLSIVLAASLRPDAEAFRPRRIEIVPNGIADPLAGRTPPRRGPSRPFQVVFLGLCSEEKGLFATVEAVLEANRLASATEPESAFALRAAGPFPDGATAERFAALQRAHPKDIQHLGTVAGPAKDALLGSGDCLCFPTRYPHEAQPLVVAEALAHDLPVIATRWRALPGMLPPETTRLVTPGDAAALTQALLELRATPPAAVRSRAHFEAHFTLSRHLATLHAALLTADGT